MLDQNKQKYIVKKVTAESSNTKSVFLTLEDGSIPEFIPGQYITIFFPELDTPEGKAYSVSSSLEENFLVITVKAMGLFSNKLCEMKKGDTFFGSLPYGYFYTEENDTELVFIAGGIGITPFRSMMLSSKDKSIRLFQSVKKESDLIFKKEFDELTQRNATISTNYFVTQENGNRTDTNYRRIEIEDILNKVKNPEKTEFFICGSISFVRDFWKNLKNSGIPDESIYTESFFS